MPILDIANLPRCSSGGRSSSAERPLGAPDPVGSGRPTRQFSVGTEGTTNPTQTPCRSCRVSCYKNSCLPIVRTSLGHPSEGNSLTMADWVSLRRAASVECDTLPSGYLPTTARAALASGTHQTGRLLTRRTLPTVQWRVTINCPWQKYRP